MNRHIGILFAIVVTISSCRGKDKGDERTAEPTDKTAQTDKDSSDRVQLSEEQLKTAALATGKATENEMATMLRVNGKVDVPPQNMVSISFPLGGYLKSTHLLAGMYVKKGEPIATMEDERYIQLQQDYLTAKAKQAYLEKEYDRQQQLNQGKATSDKVVQQAEADFRSGQIMLSALNQKLALIGVNASKLDAGNISRSVPIYSPIAGFVSKVNVNIGKYVNPTDVLFEIVNPADIHLALTVFEKDINTLAIGQEVTAYTNGNPSKKYLCRIILIGRDISADRSVEVHCHFEKYDKDLIPGTFMNAAIAASPRKVWALPEEAVVNTGGRSYIFRALDAHTFQMVEVKTGAKADGRTEIITSDMSALQNDTYVTKGAYTLLMKMKNTGEGE